MSDIVICLFSGSGYDRAAQGVVGAGRRLADQLKCNLHAVVAGAHNPELNIRVASVADAVITVDQRELSRYQPELHLNAITEICRDIAPAAVLFGNDTYSQETAPRLAHRLGGAAAGDCLDLMIQDGARPDVAAYLRDRVQMQFRLVAGQLSLVDCYNGVGDRRDPDIQLGIVRADDDGMQPAIELIGQATARANYALRRAVKAGTGKQTDNYVAHNFQIEPSELGTVPRA